MPLEQFHHRKVSMEAVKTVMRNGGHHAAEQESHDATTSTTSIELTSLQHTTNGGGGGDDSDSAALYEQEALLEYGELGDAHPPVEEKVHVGGDHDHHHGLPAEGTATRPQVATNIVISFVGAGILGIPDAFRQAGWVLGSVTLLCVSFFNVYAMLLLPQVKRALLVRQRERHVASNKNNKDTSTSTSTLRCHSYGEIGGSIMGQHGETFVNICLGISQAGFATAYLIFIAANLRSVGDIPRFVTCTMCVPGLAVLVQFRDMKHLSPFSLLANCANFAAMFAVLFQDYESITDRLYEYVDFGSSSTASNSSSADDDNNNTDDDLSNMMMLFPDEQQQQEQEDVSVMHDNNIQAVNWNGFLYVIAITIYSMEGIGLILSLEASSKEPKGFPWLLRGMLVLISTFMVCFGTAGYWAFGDDTVAPVTLNLGQEHYYAATFVKCSLCLGLYLTYPVMMFPIWSITDTLWPQYKDDKQIQWMFRTSLVVLSALVAYGVPDFGKFLSLVGSSICTILGFILPCYFHLQVLRHEVAYWQVALNYFLMIGGAFFGCLGTYNSFVAMLHGELEGPDR